MKENGAVVTRGDKDRGGDSHAVREQLTKDVVNVTSSDEGVIACRADGSVVCWGGAPSPSQEFQQPPQSGIS